MDEQSYRAKVKEEGYAEPVLIDWEANRFVDTHSHDFDAAIFVLEGEITVACEDRTSTCRIGDNEALAAGTLHTEQIGPQGVKFLAARRQDGAA